MELPDEFKGRFSSLILFDGVCNLCNGFVAFLINRDPARRFRYASLQGQTGQQMLRALQLSDHDFTTVIYIRGDHYYGRSAAVLNIARSMSGLWSLLYGLIVIPAPIRDFIYGVLARNRYRWFGRKDTCGLPTPELRSLFLE